MPKIPGSRFMPAPIHIDFFSQKGLDMLYGLCYPYGMPNMKLELVQKYFTAPEVRRKLGLSRWQLDLRINRGILPRPTYTDPETNIRYFDENWVKAAQLILASSIRAMDQQPRLDDQQSIKDWTVGQRLARILLGQAVAEDPPVVDENGLWRELKTILSERELLVLELRFGRKTGTVMTLHDVGKILPRLDGRGVGVAKERVRQLEAAALEKLNYPEHRGQLSKYIEEGVGAESK